MKRISTFFNRIRLTYSAVSKNWIVSLSSKFTIFFIIGSLGIIGWHWNVFPPAVPLWYSRPWGTEQLAHPLWLVSLPLGIMFWYCINFLLVMYHRGQYQIFTQILFLTSFMVGFLSFITLVKIVFLVT